VTRELEYLEEALQEAEAAARWYAERSVTAAAGSATKSTLPNQRSFGSRRRGLRMITEHAGTCFNAFRSALSIASKLAAS
jgi:hypothetical protein